MYYPEHRLGVVILTNLSGAYPEDIIDAVANAYVPSLRLTGVPALRNALESGGYVNVEAAAQAIEAASPGFRWPEGELNDWGYRRRRRGSACLPSVAGTRSREHQCDTPTRTPSGTHSLKLDSLPDLGTTCTQGKECDREQRGHQANHERDRQDRDGEWSDRDRT